MAMTIQQIADFLRPGLRGVTGKYLQIPRQWDKTFSTGKSRMAVERTAEARYVGLAQLKYEGGPTAMDNQSGERFVYNSEHFELGLGFSITRKAVDDNLYESEFGPNSMGLMESFQQTKEIWAANVLNTATTYNAAIGGDGVALCSASHPTDYGLIANTPTTAQLDLNEGSLYYGLTSIRTNFRDQAGLKLFARGRRLIVAPANEWTASRLTETQLRPGTGDNDVNALRATGSLPDGYLVMDFLTSPYAWFLKTNIDGLIYLERVGFEMSMDVDFTSDNLLVKGYERYFFGYVNWRALWGSFPTS